MKKLDWLMLVLAGAAAVGLRTWQMRTGFDADGLPLSGNTAALALPVVLAAAAAYFVLSARRFPAQQDMAAPFADCFLFQDNTAVIAGVVGALLLAASAAAAVAGYTLDTSALFLAPVAVAAMCSILHVIFGCYRGTRVYAMALLVPVGCLALFFIHTHLSCASDPNLADIYVRVLAVAALLGSAWQLATFAYLEGTPRNYVPVGAMAFVLALAAAAEQRSLASVLFFVGCALIELGFLAAADFRK